MNGLRKFWRRESLRIGILAALLVACSIALLTSGCGKSDTTTSPTPVASPSPSPIVVVPSPSPEPVAIIKTVALQDGKVVTSVAADTDFKISSSVTTCYIDKLPVKCPVIPYWKQRQIGGPPCRSGGDDNSGSILYNCHEVGTGLRFESCAQNFDHVDLGCGSWTILQVFSHGTTRAEMDAWEASNR